MMRSVFIVFFVILLFCSPPAHSEGDAILSLAQALERALVANPQLKASQSEVRAREDRFSQAGAIPNPDISILAEDFGGSGRFDGFGESQITLSLNQRLELGGKRSARRDVAASDAEIAQLQYERKRREVVSSVKAAFYSVLIAQQRVQLVTDILALSKQFSEVVIQRIQAGKIPPIEEMKAAAVVSSAQLELTRANRDLTLLRHKLASQWGNSQPDFESVVEENQNVLHDILFEQLSASPAAGLDVQIADMEIKQHQALSALEKSKRVPDLTISSGYRWLEVSDDYGFVLGASLPLPIFDRNKGGIGEAENRLQKMESTRAAIGTAFQNDLLQASERFRTAQLEIETLEKHVLPATQTSFDAVSEGYRLGKFGYLDVLEAQRSLFQSRIQYSDVRKDFYFAAIELERLTGSEILASKPRTAMEANHE